MFTALTLILLTLVVYLFSVTLPDDVRRQAIHASLAKAFYFPGNDEDRARAPQGPPRLLSPGRQALLALEAHLATAGGTVAWAGANLLVTLPDDFDRAAGTVPAVAHLLAASDHPVRVEATAADAGPVAGRRVRSLERAVDVTRGLIAAAGRGGERLDDGRFSAVGLGGVPVLDEVPGEAEGAGVRVVLVNARGSL
jgi:hypothetical protein